MTYAEQASGSDVLTWARSQPTLQLDVSTVRAVADRVKRDELYEIELGRSAADRVSRDARAAVATGLCVGTRVELVDIASEQRTLLGRRGTVRGYTTVSTYEVCVVLDEPWGYHDTEITLPAYCWRVLDSRNENG